MAATLVVASGPADGNGPAGDCPSCRPPWNRTEYKETCEIPKNMSWPEITYAAAQGNLAFKTGSLGVSAVSPRFEVWICLWGHDCDLDHGSFCFVYDEIDQYFVPWGPNSELEIFKNVSTGTSPATTTVAATPPPTSTPAAATQGICVCIISFMVRYRERERE